MERSFRLRHFRVESQFIGENNVDAISGATVRLGDTAAKQFRFQTFGHETGWNQMISVAYTRRHIELTFFQ